MSSVFGLNASPQTPKVRPFRSSPKRATHRFRRRRFWLALTSSTASSKEESTPRSLMVRASAFTSLGKHEPP